MASKNGFNGPEGSQHEGFKKGQSGNTKSNSKVRVKKSKIRSLLEKLQEREDIAIALVDRSLNEQEVNAESLASAKWLLSSINTITKTASAEELGNFNARLKGKREEEEEEQSPQQIQQESKARLSLVYNAPDEDED